MKNLLFVLFLSLSLTQISCDKEPLVTSKSSILQSELSDDLEYTSDDTMNIYDRNEINLDNNSGILLGPPTSSGDCLYFFEIYSWTSTDPNCTSPGPATFEFESASTGQTYTHTINLTGQKNIFLPKDDTYYLWIYDDGSGDCIN